MTIQQLNYVITISEKGSLNKAAEVLFVTQPSLTSAVRELEKELGITLFNRGGKGVTLTNDGAEFIQYARQVVTQYERLLEKYGKGGNLRKKFGISCQHYSFAVKSFVEMVKQFDTDEYEFAIRESKTRDVIEDVTTGKSEVGILYLSDFNRKAIGKFLKSSQLEFHPLIKCEPYVYLWKGHPLAKKKSICTSRSFNGMITDLEDLRTHVANYAARCAEKLRQQKTVASIVGVFLHTNLFREDLAQYWNYQETRLVTPTSATISIVQAANDVLKSIYRPGYRYKKAGVIVMGIGPDSPIQQDLFDINAEQFQKMRRLDEVVDRINRLHGSETIVLGSQQYTAPNGKGRADVFANAIRHDHKSPNPTTRWSDIIPLNKQ